MITIAFFTLPSIDTIKVPFAICWNLECVTIMLNPRSFFITVDLEVSRTVEPKVLSRLESQFLKLFGMEKRPEKRKSSIKVSTQHTHTRCFEPKPIFL